MRSIDILGVSFDDMSIAEAVERSIRAIDQRVAAYVLPVGSELLLEADRNSPLTEAINSAGLVLADDKGISMASHVLGLPLKHKMSGEDYTDEMRAYAEKMIAASEEAPELEGCVPVDEELAGMLQLIIDKYSFKGVRNAWTKLCYYYKALNETYH